MGGGGGSDSFDSEYNSRMAEIAEEQFKNQEVAFNSWNAGGGRDFEEAQYNAGIELLPYKTEFEKTQMDYGTKKMGYQSGLMGRFYDELGKHDEGLAVGQASADVAGAISKSKASNVRNNQRMGISPPTGGSGLDAAKLEVGAITGARDKVKAQNLQELSMGMQI